MAFIVGSNECPYNTGGCFDLDSPRCRYGLRVEQRFPIAFPCGEGHGLDAQWDARSSTLQNALYRAVELPDRELHRPDGCTERVPEDFICYSKG